MKNPSPPPLVPPIWLPPPEIISAATTTSQVMPMPTAEPTTIEGSVPGSMTRRQMSQRDEPIERAAWKYRTSIERRPPSTLMTMAQQAPRKVMKAIGVFGVGQKLTEVGT